MHIDEAAQIVCTWASDNRLVSAVQFFGSRVRGDNHLKSDLDVAVSIAYEDPDTCLAYWFENQEQWQGQLQSRIPWKMDLQFHHHAVPGIVLESVCASSKPVFERDA